MQYNRICKWLKNTAIKQISKFILQTTVLTVLTVCILPKAAAYTGVPSYFAREIATADQLWAIIPASAENKNLSVTLTRGEFCEVIIRACEKLDGGLPAEALKSYFSDTDTAYVNSAYRLGIVSGYPDGTFREDKRITRQEMFKMIYNFMILRDAGSEMSDQEAIEILMPYVDAENVSDWAEIPAASAVSKGIVQGTDTKMLDPLSDTTYAQAIVLVNRVLNTLVGNDPNYTLPEEIETPTNSATPANLATPLNRIGYNDQKYILVFGSLENDGYQTSTEAKSNMVSIIINVWKISATGEKVPGTLSVTVNKAIADTCKSIFQEIYDGPEKFPIKSIGGYAWRTTGTSEHSMGLAIDINPNENYMIKRDGTVVSGSFWNPQTSPYSIAVDGDVVRTFNKYGFAWGGNAWRSSNDYMHFSYFGE